MAHQRRDVHRRLADADDWPIEKRARASSPVSSKQAITWALALGLAHPRQHSRHRERAAERALNGIRAAGRLAGHHLDIRGGGTGRTRYTLHHRCSRIGFVTETRIMRAGSRPSRGSARRR
ncbi:hypothetical protein J4E08_06870 [Sagittula sp. NFXS13]|uniref:hypothetical protein n=1 Tax=Sagittula sp. NFXS13 TaxID=2819095 RepID=UPI0032DFEC42